MALGNAEPEGRPAAQTAAPSTPHGRPAVKDRPELIERIAAMRSANMTLQQIAEQFNAEGIPTLRGGRSGARRASRPRWATGAQVRPTACRR